MIDFFFFFYLSGYIESRDTITDTNRGGLTLPKHLKKSEKPTLRVSTFYFICWFNGASVKDKTV